jgi:nicotine blue oxidoreductase
VGVAAVILAAGAASRFGSPKQRLLLPRVLARLEEVADELDEIVAVEGAHRLGPLAGVRVVSAPDWERGPGASLRAGLAALGPETEAAVICLADGPLLAPEAVRRVLATWRDGPGDAVAASYGGARSHPLVLGRASWGAVPDGGLRELPVSLVPCDDLGAPGDVDTLDDLEALAPGED